MREGDETLLDNPIWHSLTGAHARFGVGGGQARQYLPEIGPLAGLAEPTAEAYVELARLVPPGKIAVLFQNEVIVPPKGWERVKGGTLVQMICREVRQGDALQSEIAALSENDFPEMVALATLTEPGPFRGQTARLGQFLGVRVEGRLAAMAGTRLAPAGFVEVSAVCTHPDFRGRGYARALVAAVARGIQSEGSVPFLTAYEHNTGAIRVYEEVGFALRRRIELAVLKPPPQA